MAVLAPSDWQYLPRDSHAMDLPSNNSRQQRSSPANDGTSPSPTTAPPHGSHPQFQQMNHQQSQQPPQQPYPYPVQQQPQGSWTPSISAQPFYPSFYQNHQQSPQGYPQLPQQAPYFDPANAQLAQWAYQQMMFNAQQGFIPPQQTRSSSGRSGSGPSPDYFAQNQMNPMFNPFPSGTPPPPHPNRTASVDQQQQQQQQNGQYPGFHPYRRPVRQGSSQSHPHAADGEWRPANMPIPPYARPDASGSSSSVNSTNSQRQRTNSNQSGNSGQNTPPGGSIRSRNGSPAAAGNQQPVSTATAARSSPSGSTSSTSSATPAAPKLPHNRNLSSSSAGSYTASSRPSGLAPSITSPPMSTTSSTPPSSASSTNLRPARPSPLSQGTFTASEKRMSRDDSDLAAMLESTPSAAMIRSGGLKGRLRRALTFNAQQQALKEEEDDDDASIKASALGSSSSKLKPKSAHSINTVVGQSNPGGGVPSPDIDDAESTATVQTKKKSRAASLFNSRLNASTDNISLSSTVSSASVMIRKLGSMGKLARRNSLAGITSLFKDKEKKNKEKEKEEGESADKKGKKKKSAKAEASEASVSHVTAELDRSAGDWGGPEMNGLSPAAKLARQHTLKSNAEAAAKAKAQQEATVAAAAAAAVSSTQPNGYGSGAGVPTWEKNTHTRQGSVSPVKGGGGFRINEDGTRVLVEDDDEDRSDDGHYGVPTQSPGEYNPEGWDDDEDWDGEDDEDVTIRMGIGRVSLDNEYEEPDPWATDIRRSVERTRVPAKGILKHAATYDQKSYMTENVTANRLRSNSYNSHTHQAELGPLARIPSPDPDHIDGLHRHGSHSSGHGSNSTITAAPTIPPLSFEPSAPSPIRATNFDSPRDSIDSTSTVSHVPHPPEKSSLLFSHSNSSAPALSTISSKAPTLTHRSATTPSKRLAFANNLSVYDTFPSSVYDRRSEPATWSRLTPALAQRIKEELNSYKMEEMEVHAASRIHTQFFV
ncbi:hypothetical protein C8R41DRAFT_549813 [Lentinula lateritia]|uniref:Protein BNI4 n=1 Tax=Lentinula lateritia TaxID=40482 RepID=A0ABQ8V5C8_9AGAR|nr:hypothetical protein C8R41DRAFT_549813 [Lentinula lateritia]